MYVIENTDHGLTKGTVASSYSSSAIVRTEICLPGTYIYTRAYCSFSAFDIPSANQTDLCAVPRLLAKAGASQTSSEANMRMRR